MRAAGLQTRLEARQGTLMRRAMFLHSLREKQEDFSLPKHVVAVDVCRCHRAGWSVFCRSWLSRPVGRNV